MLAEAQRATYKAVKTLIEHIKNSNGEVEAMGSLVSFIGPPGFQAMPRALQVKMLSTNEAAKMFGVHFVFSGL